MPRFALSFDAAAPTIIVPLTGASDDELAAEVAALAGLGVPLVEWRVDRHLPTTRALPSTEQAVATLRVLADRLDEHSPGTALLATFRTSAEGGSADIPAAAYVELVAALARSGLADAVDVEISHARADEAIAAAGAAGTPVVASNHDFDATPGRDELVARLADMEARGADVAKIAVTPRSPADVAVLLDATARRFAESSIPLITMSMGELGAVSRLVGGQFGSSATFATVGQASAPGQVPLSDVRAALDLLARRRAQE